MENNGFADEWSENGSGEVIHGNEVAMNTNKQGQSTQIQWFTCKYCFRTYLYTQGPGNADNREIGMMRWMLGINKGSTYKAAVESLHPQRCTLDPWPYSYFLDVPRGNCVAERPSNASTNSVDTSTVTAMLLSPQQSDAESNYVADLDLLL